MAMRNVVLIAKRELKSYFATPVAFVFIVIFLALTGAFAFFMGGFFSRGQADLEPFFAYHPWLYLLFIPAISMRLWAEERKTGTIENLMTLPISTSEAVVGKFLAAWLFSGISHAHFPDLGHGERARRTRQWCHHRELCWQFVDGRWISGHRLLSVCGHKEPGDSVYRGGDGLFPLHDERCRSRAEFLPRVGTGYPRRHDRVLQFPHAFQRCDERRN